MAINIHELESEDAWAAVAADELAAVLSNAVAKKGSAALAAAGGGTPGPILRKLASADLPWNQITIAPTDDRRVADDHPARNLTMLRDALGAGHVAGARIIALEDAPEDFQPDAILLGFGNDQHVASIFPAGEGMIEAMTQRHPTTLLTTPDPLPPEAPHGRVSLTMPALLAADLIVIAAKGEQKRETFEAAKRSGPEGSPLAHVVHTGTDRIEFVWRP